MAAADLRLSDALCGYAVPGILVLVAVLALYRYGRRIHRYVLTVFYANCLCHSTDEKLRPFKRRLFVDLENLESRDWDLRNQGLLRILEIGSGPGANFQYFPKNSRLVCYDPNPLFQKYLFENHSHFAEVNLERFVVAGGEKLVGTADDSVDVVVSTLVNCAVKDMRRVLSEIKRVLAPGGRYYFLDHVAAPKGSGMYRLQKLTNPVWQTCMDCDLQRDVEGEVKAAGFSSVHVEPFCVHFSFPFSLVVNDFVMGYATK